jgi:hypothetical protein
MKEPDVGGVSNIEIIVILEVNEEIFPVLTNTSGVVPP